MSDSELYGPLRAHLTTHLDDYLAMLARMVAINSFTANPAGVNALGDLTAAVFAPLGFAAEMIPSVNPAYGRHLVLTRHGRSDDGRSANGRTPPKIGLVSHLDTVFPPEEEAANDFTWRPDGDRLYGPGTVDIKGGTVLIYMMLDALRAAAPRVFEETTWVILLDASEETDGADFGDLCLQRLAPDALACLIFEGGAFDGGAFDVVAARKGMAIYETVVTGRAAHAGSAHEMGANAIVQLADAIQHISRFTDYERDLTFNLGVVSGGTVTNRVPHEARALIEMRAFDTAVYDDGVARMMALNELSTVRSAADGFPCRVQVQVTRRTPPWPRNAATDRLLAAWQEAGAALGYTVRPEARGGLSDGNYFWQQLPCLDGLGPAGGNAHCSERSADGSKDQEYALRSSFVPKALLNVAAVLRLLQGTVISNQ